MNKEYLIGDSKVYNEFKGDINGIEFNNRLLFEETYWVLIKIEDYIYRSIGKANNGGYIDEFLYMIQNLSESSLKKFKENLTILVADLLKFITEDFPEYSTYLVRDEIVDSFYDKVEGRFKLKYLEDLEESPFDIFSEMKYEIEETLRSKYNIYN